MFHIKGLIKIMDNKHLDYVQNTITRMADNSFKIKGLCVTIVSAFLGLCIKYDEPKMLLILCLPIIFLWLLDGYYLQQERKFRCIYNNLTGNPTSCNVKIPSFGMPLKDIKGKGFNYVSSLFSKTECFLYIPLLFCNIVLYFILHKM